MSTPRPDHLPGVGVGVPLRSERILSKSSIPSSPRSGHVEHASGIGQVEEVLDAEHLVPAGDDFHLRLCGELVPDRFVGQVGPLDELKQAAAHAAKPPIALDLFAVDPL